MDIIANKVFTINYKNKTYEVHVNEALFKQMNYDWNSYNFIDKDYLFVFIGEVSSNNIVTLTTSGYDGNFVVLDLKTNEEIIDWYKILELSKNEKLCDTSTEYSVEEGNWFSIDFLNSNCINYNHKFEECFNSFIKNNNLDYIDSHAFCFRPENFEELLQILINEHKEFFND